MLHSRSILSLIIHHIQRLNSSNSPTILLLAAAMLLPHSILALTIDPSPTYTHLKQVTHHLSAVTKLLFCCILALTIHQLHQLTSGNSPTILLLLLLLSSFPAPFPVNLRTQLTNHQLTIHNLHQFTNHHLVAAAMPLPRSILALTIHHLLHHLTSSNTPTILMLLQCSFSVPSLHSPSITSTINSSTILLLEVMNDECEEGA
jgi:hypothetical protein